MIEKINALRAEIEALKATSAEELEQLRIKYLSKKGAVSALMNDFRSVPAEMKRDTHRHPDPLRHSPSTLSGGE